MVKDIFTYNLDSFIKAAESTTQTMQLFLTLVAVISLVVGDWCNEYYAGFSD